MVQVIPFLRNSTGIPTEIRTEMGAERAARQSVTRNTQSAPGWYRTEARDRR
jgi:hypothetical protein